MQYRPSMEDLLLAVADFIESDVRPRLDDEAMAFRCLIAANLARMTVLERRMEEWHDGLELDGMRALMPDAGAPADSPAEKDARLALLQGLNQRLADRLKAGGDEAFAGAAAAHLRTVLAGRLNVTNPRFDADFGW